MINNQISLEGSLFLQAFKAFVEKDETSYMGLLTIMSYQFEQIQIVLKHKGISQQLIPFLNKAKEVVSLNTYKENKFNKLKNINSILNRAYLEEWQRKYKKAYQLNIQGAKLSKRLNVDEAIKKYSQSIKIMATEDALVNLANLYLTRDEFSLFRKCLQSAESIANDSSLLPIYESIFQRILPNSKSYERYLCAKVMIRYGSKDKSAYFDYVLEAVKRKEQIDKKKIMLDFPQCFEKRICQCIIKEGDDPVYLFQERQKQIIKKLSYPNSKQHKQSKEYQLLQKIDLFYLYFSRACAKSIFSYKKRNFYIQRGLNYKPKSYYLLKQMCLLNNRNPRLTQTTAQNCYLFRSLAQLESSNNKKKIFDRESIQIAYSLLVQLQPKQGIVSFINDLTREHEKQHQVYILAAKMSLQYGDLASAERYCQQYQKLESRNAKYYTVRGQIHCKKNKIAEAKECFQNACDMDGKNFTANFCLASLYYFQKNYQICISLLSQVDTKYNDQLQLKKLSQLKFKAYYKMRNYELADEEVMNLMQSFKMSQISGEIAFSCAEVKFHKGQYKDAIKLYQKAIQTHPKHNQSRYKLLLTQVIDNPCVNGEQLEKMLENARSMISKQKNDTLYLTLYGYLLIKSQRYEDAFEVLSQSINRNPQSCYAYYHIGRLLKDQSNSFHPSAVDELGQRANRLASPAKQYANSFLLLAARQNEKFISNFDNIFKYYKEKMNGSKTMKKQFQTMFKRLIGNFHYLNAIYPGSDELLLITAMLYRVINDERTVQKFILEFLSKYRVGKQPLSEVLFNFYNRNYNYHKTDNYFPFFLSFIYQQMLEHHPWELMSIRHSFKNSLNRFEENQAINSSIINYLNQIRQTIKQFKPMSNQLKQEMSAFVDVKEAEAKIDQCFKRLIQSHLRPRKAYKTYNYFDLSKDAVNYNRIKESEGMKLLNNHMQQYQVQIKQSSVNKVQLLNQITNFVVVLFTFNSLWPFIYNESKQSEIDFKGELTRLIKILIDKRNIEQSIKTLSNFIHLLILNFRSLQRQGQNTNISPSINKNSLENELANMFSFNRANHSPQFSLQPPITISKCRQYQIKNNKPFENNELPPFNRSIFITPSKINRSSTTVINTQEDDGHDFD